MRTCSRRSPPSCPRLQAGGLEPRWGSGRASAASLLPGTSTLAAFLRDELSSVCRSSAMLRLLSRGGAVKPVHKPVQAERLVRARACARRRDQRVDLLRREARQLDQQVRCGTRTEGVAAIVQRLLDGSGPVPLRIAGSLGDALARVVAGPGRRRLLQLVEHEPVSTIDLRDPAHQRLLHSLHVDRPPAPVVGLPAGREVRAGARDLHQGVAPAGERRGVHAAVRQLCPQLDQALLPVLPADLPQDLHDARRVHAQEVGGVELGDLQRRLRIQGAYRGVRLVPQEQPHDLRLARQCRVVQGRLSHGVRGIEVGLQAQHDLDEVPLASGSGGVNSGLPQRSLEAVGAEPEPLAAADDSADRGDVSSEAGGPEHRPSDLLAEHEVEPGEVVVRLEDVDRRPLLLVGEGDLAEEPGRIFGGAPLGPRHVVCKTLRRHLRIEVAELPVAACKGPGGGKAAAGCRQVEAEAHLNPEVGLP
mmetsp:Transcript_92479/g.275839  ORF Transcript_92479/g.275839 Transcript_92479/m.275839 type:complete len:475 (-) Transcript_92479:1646-3070(-)